MITIKPQDHLGDFIITLRYLLVSILNV